jgi:endonuclease-3 related protein
VADLQKIYKILYDYFGPQNWWPADSIFEVIVGTVLTQNTNWQNVSRALDNLKEDNLLSLAVLHSLPLDFLAEKIRPSGYYNIKAKRLKNLLDLLAADADESSSDEKILADFFNDDLQNLRQKLLTVKGVGPETADSILLYAGHKPIFVIDTYTYRILVRHGLVGEETDYNEMQELFMGELPDDPQLFNEYHALLVRLGKEFCKKRNPLCQTCPLRIVEPIFV